jgi:hypothetical protein
VVDSGLVSMLLVMLQLLLMMSNPQTLYTIVAPDGFCGVTSRASANDVSRLHAENKPHPRPPPHYAALCCDARHIRGSNGLKDWHRGLQWRPSSRLHGSGNHATSC